ncbi:MAG: phage major capsid protein [Parabacteroides sp.]|nr:phage major capsid protein [Parabacteroides sp.]
MPTGYDFCGWASKNDLLCSDGRTIRRGAFASDDGKKVPMVYQHQHTSIDNVLGHAILENRDEGMYAYCYLNESDTGKMAKELVRHGDICAMSIYANKLKQIGNDVVHGEIKEVSLVLAAANPGAAIESVVLEHSDGSTEEEAIIYSGEDTQYKILSHAESSTQTSSDKTVNDILNNMSEAKKNVLYYMLAKVSETDEEAEDDDVIEDSDIRHADVSGGRTIQDIFDTFTSDEKKVAFFLIGQAIKESGSMEQSDIPNIDDESEENDTMKHNVFENNQFNNDETVLSHAEIEEIFRDTKQYGTLKNSALAHGVTNIEYLFPDATTVTPTPELIKRNDDWVSKVMGSVHRTPFSRIKSTAANLTEEDARAKGYMKGKLKKDEVFSLLKRTTEPTTIYKKQKLDRDDVVDITDFDVVAWIKSEMRMMLNEEIARAILIGDGRLTSSDDKIPEDHIRPVAFDSELYTVPIEVTVAAQATDDDKAKAIIRSIIKGRKEYKGSGNPVMYTTEDVLTDMLLMEDKMGRVVYDSVTKLATALRVSEIVTVPVMEGLKDSENNAVIAVIVNLADYNVGADRGGEVNMFDDFDIDYNAMKYLIETRCSGALTKPYSALAVKLKTAGA